jgi:hypothetical protein
MDKIQMRTTHATLAKGGSTMARAVAYGSQQYGGLAMIPLWVKQLAQQVQAVVKHMRCPGDCNIMFRITFAWAQQSTGMGFHLLEHPNLWVPQLECQWIISIRNGLAEIKAKAIHRMKTACFFFWLSLR